VLELESMEELDDEEFEELDDDDDIDVLLDEEDRDVLLELDDVEVFPILSELSELEDEEVFPILSELSELVVELLVLVYPSEVEEEEDDEYMGVRDWKTVNLCPLLK